MWPTGREGEGEGEEGEGEGEEGEGGRREKVKEGIILCYVSG